MEKLTADELYNISTKKKISKVNNVLVGAIEHIENRILQEANKGSLEYDFRVNKIETYCLELLKSKLIELVQELEIRNIKVLICDYGNGYWSEVTIHISWSGLVPKGYEGFGFNNRVILYETEEQ